MSAEIWSCNPDVAKAVSETAGMSRERLTARLDFLAPTLTDDDALRGLVVAAMTSPKRAIDGRGLAAVVGRWPGDESDAEVARALEGIS